MKATSPSSASSQGNFEYQNVQNERSGLITPVTKRKPQIIATFIVTLGAVGLGTVLGWSSPALHNLEKSKELGNVSVQMKSWIASIVNLGTLTSGIATGFTMDRIGRRVTLLIFSLPFSFGWILLACSQSFTMMLIGRFVTGLCGGIWIAVVPVYISEMAEDRIRGMLSSVMVFGLTLGILFSYVVGSFMSWIWLSIINSVFPLAFLGSMLYFRIPESPRYLLAHGNSEKGAEALAWFRGANSTSQIQTELAQIQESINHSTTAARATWIDYLHRPIIKPIFICIMLMFFQQFGGINAVIFNSMDIFKAAGVEIDPNLATIIIGITQVIMVAISTVLVDSAGRRILLIISEAGMSVSLIALGVFFTLKEQNDGHSPGNLAWLPLVSLVLFMISYNIALASVPWVIMGEILPYRVKRFAVPLVTSTNSALGFIITKQFQLFTELLGTSTIFYIFGSISAIGVLFAALILPETRGKSLDQIQELFK